MAAQVTFDLAAVAERIRGGDRTAEDEFVEIFHGRVMRMVNARVRDPQQARDISQEVLLGVIAALRKGRLRNPEKLTQFVCGTARHLVCEHFRQKRWLGTVDFSILPTDAAPLDEAFGFRESLGKVRLAFHDLTPRDQGIVGMSVVTGMGSKEMARRTGMSPVQVRQRKSRAIRRMRSQVDLQLS